MAYFLFCVCPTHSKLYCPPPPVLSLIRLLISKTGNLVPVISSSHFSFKIIFAHLYYKRQERTERNDNDERADPSTNLVRTDESPIIGVGISRRICVKE
jgi:hypothetical protein